ncbi:hypothetical protein Pla175_01460 [Pirellulimonas nuda]|uniref:Uncharacterized protein n=1 Tax=Pirellulimonas nuda TaxID=2528009 RepID=A0A518D5P6_9BACT|nr:hypothetical protein Pla175_01460 [Pirellulimonas nuda]
MVNRRRVPGVAGEAGAPRRSPLSGVGGSSPCWGLRLTPPTPATLRVHRRLSASIGGSFSVRLCALRGSVVVRRPTPRPQHWLMEPGAMSTLAWTCSTCRAVTFPSRTCPRQAWSMAPRRVPGVAGEAGAPRRSRLRGEGSCSPCWGLRLTPPTPATLRVHRRLSASIGGSFSVRLCALRDSVVNRRRVPGVAGEAGAPRRSPLRGEGSCSPCWGLRLTPPTPATLRVHRRSSASIGGSFSVRLCALRATVVNRRRVPGVAGEAGAPRRSRLRGEGCCSPCWGLRLTPPTPATLRVHRRLSASIGGSFLRPSSCPPRHCG